jgi:hypothetical protein
MQDEGLPSALFQEVTNVCFDEFGLCALLDGCLHYDADTIALVVKSSCWGKIWKPHGERQFGSSSFPVRARSNKPDRYCNRFL